MDLEIYDETKTVFQKNSVQLVKDVLEYAGKYIA